MTTHALIDVTIKRRYRVTDAPDTKASYGPRVVVRPEEVTLHQYGDERSPVSSVWVRGLTVRRVGTITASREVGWAANLARDPEACTWGHLAKVVEEAGEVIAAYIGATGQNPRKGTTHDMADVEKELLDVALTALCAYEHVTGHGGRALPNLMRFVEERRQRALGAVPPILDPLAGLTECPVTGCPDEFADDLSDNDGWAHGVRHVHVTDVYLVREDDVRTAPEPTCPACLSAVAVDKNGCVSEHQGWGQGGAYAVRCPGSGRKRDELLALLSSDGSDRQQEGA